MARGGSPLTLAADFEAMTDPDDCRVWAYGWADVAKPNDVHLGVDIVAFLRELAGLGRTIVYFHNLKYDGTFIIDWLLRHGFNYVDDQRLLTNEFTVLYSRTGKIYSLRVQWGKNRSSEFRDSFKILPMSISDMAGAFNLPMKKGEIDYHRYRAPGEALTEEDAEYVVNDVSILAHAVAETIKTGHKKLTAGSNSMAEFKAIHGIKRYRTTFPVLSPELDMEIRRAYRGGYTYAAKRFRGRKINRRGAVYDVNSLYPFIMRTKSLPYGIPEPFDGPPPVGQLSTFTVTFTAKLRPKHIPVIQVKKSSRFHESEYLESIDEPVTLTVTNIDWELYCEHYKVNVISYGGGYIFKHKTGIFDEFIDKWMEIKANSTGGMRTLAKLILNSCYGKFGTSTDVTGKWPDLENNHVTWHLNDDEKRDPEYTPMAVFITAYARELTIRAAQANYDVFAYADTDSLHLLMEEAPNIRIHPSDLGAWKHEYDFDVAFYMRAKAYMEQHTAECPCKECQDGPTRTTRIAGLQTAISSTLDFNDLYDGHVIRGKLVPRNVPGGVVLVDTPYELKM